MTKYFQIKQVSALTGINSETLRYYEKVGLIKPIRGENGYRLYSESELHSLRFIKTCRSLGFDLKSTQSLDELRRHPEQNCHKADEIASHHLVQVQSKINELTKIAKFLQSLANCPETDSAHCKVLSSLDGELQNGLSDGLDDGLNNRLNDGLDNGLDDD